MHRGVFTDRVIQGLTTDVSILDSIVGVAWSADNEHLLIRVQPINPEAWREIGELIVDNIRELGEKMRFKARLQTLIVDGVRNLIFALKPMGNPLH